MISYLKFIVIVLAVFFQPTLGNTNTILCYKCKTLYAAELPSEEETPSSTISPTETTPTDTASTDTASTETTPTDTPPTEQPLPPPAPLIPETNTWHEPSPDDWLCDDFAAVTDTERETQFTVSCSHGCSLGVDIPTTVNGSGIPFQLGFEYRGCFDASMGMKMDTCLETYKFLDVFKKEGEKFMKEKNFTMPTEDTMKMCSCDVDLCNLDLNHILYYPAHYKRQQKLKEQWRQEEIDDDEERRRLDLGNDAVTLNGKLGVWSIIVVIIGNLI